MWLLAAAAAFLALSVPAIFVLALTIPLWLPLLGLLIVLGSAEHVTSRTHRRVRIWKENHRG